MSQAADQPRHQSRPRGIGQEPPNFFCQDLRTLVGADIFDEYSKDPRVHTDAEVTVDEVAKGYPTAEGLVGPQSDAIYYESVVSVSRFEQNQLVELRLYPIELGRSKRLPIGECFRDQNRHGKDTGVIRLKPARHYDVTRVRKSQA
ncbi:hypothetical protein ACFHWW_33390 [Ensifer sp. P24N7]